VNSSTRELNSSQSSSPMMRVREVQKVDRKGEDFFGKSVNGDFPEGTRLR
jgi:hypothetical protein